MGAVLFLLTQLVFLHTVSGFFLINVAKGKPAAASSLLNINYRASSAVDGIQDTITSTGRNKSYAWWKVDLQREVQDATVKIHFSTNTWIRNGVQLYTSASPFSTYPSGQLCHTVTGERDGSDIPVVYPATCAGRWRYLLFYTNTDNNGLGSGISFGEVEVFACADNLYGPICNLLCIERKCINASSPCHHVTGRCDSGCQAGYKGPDCRQECRSGFYGSGCSMSCTDRKCLKSSSLCHHVTGQCVGGCRTGYKDPDCATCVLGDNYGVNCSNSCSARHCMTSSSLPPDCDPQTGQCPDGCESGWTGGDCSINIKDPLPLSTFIGALIGTCVTVILICGGTLACLLRQGRLEWVRNSTGKNTDHVSNDRTQPSTIFQQPGTSGHAQTGGHVHNIDYLVPDTEMDGQETYDDIRTAD